MSRLASEQLIHDLARDVPPVRRVPRLRSEVLALAAVWALACAGLWWLESRSAELVTGAAWGDARFVLVLLGLALVAGGATLAALAGAVPGREAVAAAAGAGAGLGVGLALGGGLWAVLGAAAPADAAQLASGLTCLGKACAVGSLPLVLAALFLARGWVQRPRLAAGLAVMGAVALGGVAIHLGCRDGGALHLLVGHALPPLLLGLALALPVASWLRR